MQEGWEQSHRTMIRNEEARLHGGKEGNRAGISAVAGETGFVQSGEEEGVLRSWSGSSAMSQVKGPEKTP